jgi:hypothetical protein
MIVLIQIPKANRGCILPHQTWRKAIAAAVAMLRDEHRARAVKRQPETLLRAQLDECEPSPATPGGYKLTRRYRISLDCAECRPVVRPADPWIPKRKKTAALQEVE